MLLGIIRWLRGYVQFTVSGKFPERFINIVTSAHLPIWKTKNDGEVLTAEMYLSDYKNIRPYAKKSRVRLKNTGKFGLPFYVKKYKNRLGVLIGLLAFILIVAVMSSFVWTIEITGLETLSYTEVLSALKENGLYSGAFKGGISYPAIGRNTMLDIDKIGWMSINVLGTHACVEIKEKELSPKVDDISKPCNIKAKCDGVIKSIDTLSGVAFFKAGSAVVKDQLIVSSVVEDSLGGVSLVRANARIIASTIHKKSFETEKETLRYSFKEPKHRCTVSVLGFDLNLSSSFLSKENSAYRYTTNACTLLDTVLPVNIKDERISERSSSTEKLTKAEAKSILENRAALYMCFALSDCTVTDIKAKLIPNDKYVYTVTYFCEEDIAQPQEIGIENMTIQKKTHEQIQKELQNPENN